MKSEFREPDEAAFARLFEEACRKCFGDAPGRPLAESESRLFGRRIQEQTGLTIGWKSLKNYSHYLFKDQTQKRENPSLATLDTLARYALGAPRTSEIERKRDEGHYPWWFQFRDRLRPLPQGEQPQPVGRNILSAPVPPRRPYALRIALALGALVILVTLVMWIDSRRADRVQVFEDHFTSLQEDSLQDRGWMIQGRDPAHWARRGELPGTLTLFTLRGDSWPDTVEAPHVSDLMLRRIPGGCFDAEVHFRDFVPERNWQQAGIILLKDTSLTGSSVRLTLAYNDYYGGFPGSRDVLVQAIASLGKELPKPEEIAHKLLFRLGGGQDSLVRQNLKYSALRIEKRENKLRFLYSNGAMQNSAFTELAVRESGFAPAFLGIIAQRGFVGDSTVMPVRVTFFNLTTRPCAPEHRGG